MMFVIPSILISNGTALIFTSDLAETVLETVYLKIDRINPEKSVEFGLIQVKSRSLTPKTGVQTPLGTPKISRG